MGHADAIAARLPRIYGDGELLRGFIGAPGLQIEILDEILLEVQRAHWFDTTVELAEAARLAAPLDIPPEPWQDLALYRVWVHAMRDAMLDEGAVTPRAIEAFVVEYVAGFEAARAVRVVGAIGDFLRAPSASKAVFLENPPRRAWAAASDNASADGGATPLAQFTWANRGLIASEIALMMTGLPAGPECAPLLVNTTTGDALLYLGAVPPGAELAIVPDGKGGVTARLDGQDVSGRLRSLHDLAPGTPWPPSSIDTTPRALRLLPGDNQMWFLPVAHTDTPGLDRFLLALPDLTLSDGRYDAARLDQAIFYEPPAVRLRATWLEAQPASFEVQLPGGTMLGAAGQLDANMVARGQLADSLATAVDRLRAAGVRSSVRLRSFSEVQRAHSRLTGVLPKRVRERGPTGVDSLPDLGALFLVTNFDDSTFR